MLADMCRTGFFLREWDFLISGKERQLTVNFKVCGGLADDGLRIWRQGVFAVDLGLAAVGGGRAGPDVDVIYTPAEIGRWRGRLD